MVPDGARIGIIGPNGAGKSTMLRIVGGTEDVNEGEVVRRRGVTVSYLEQNPEGDDRTAEAWVLAGRPDIAALDDELRVDRGRARAARGHGRPREDGPRPRQTAGGARPLGGSRWTWARGGGEEPAPPPRLRRPRPDAPHDRALRRPAQARRVRRMPDPRSGPAPPRRARDAPRLRQAGDPRGRRRGVPRGRRHRVPRPLPPGRHGEPDRRARSRQRRMWPGYVLGVRPRQGARAPAPAARSGSRSRRRSRGSRRRSPGSSFGPPGSPNERHIRQARNKQRQIDRMDKVDRPVFERRKMALELRPAERGGQRIARLRDVSMSFDDDPVLLDATFDVYRRERLGVVGPNGAREDRARQDPRRRARGDIGRAVGRSLDPDRVPGAGLPGPGPCAHAGRDRPQDEGDVRRRGRRAPREVPVPLRPDAHARRVALRRRAHAARALPVDALGRELSRSSTSRRTISISRAWRCWRARWSRSTGPRS